MNQPTIFERAFAIAREGHARSVEDIRRKLKAERFDGVESHLAGPTIQRQLKKLLADANASDVR